MEASTQKENQIFKIIDSILTQVFGEEATTLIYKYIEQNYSLHKKDIPKKIDVFTKGLEECLSTSALIIENKILEHISETYGSNNTTLKKESKYDFACQMKVFMQNT
ncbi:MAG: hypothetical protein N3E52_05375 [Candidatus Bathyarchaeota archaeon]|nr:hypothetical protein [Candidatus Bathyarchaeota archaeon]